ncbi:hypothetical protein VTO42DRAFT_3655 [Malbranchea cinnamomea]
MIPFRSGFCQYLQEYYRDVPCPYPQRYVRGLTKDVLLVLLCAYYYCMLSEQIRTDQQSGSRSSALTNWTSLSFSGRVKLLLFTQ